MRKLLLFVFFSLFAISLAGCSAEGNTEAEGNEGDSANSAKDTLVIGIDDDPPQLDPHRSSAAVDSQVYQNIYNKLINMDENQELVPELAKSWTVSDDGLTYTFILEEGVLFHDGTPFNAEAVKFNFERMLDPDMASPRFSEVNMIKEVNVINEYEVEIVLSQIFAPFLSALVDRPGMMVSPTAVKELGEDFSNQPVGTGPYKFASRELQSYIKLERFEDYWAEAPAIANVEIRPFPDANVRVTNLVSGKLDILNKIAYKDIKSLRDSPDITLLERGALGFQGIHLNTKVAPFNNKAIRQAINLAIDREAVSQVVFHGGAVPAVSAFAPASWASPSFEQPNADLEAARKLVAESGVDDISFTLTINSNSEQQQLAQMIQSMLSEVDITMEIEIVEFGTILEKLNSGDFQAVRLGWSGLRDPDGNVYRFFHSEAANNYSGYSNPELDKLLTEARTVEGEEERKEMYEEVSKILWEDSPYVFIYHERDYKAMKSNVQGYRHIADTMIRTDTLYFE